SADEYLEMNVRIAPAELGQARRKPIRRELRRNAESDATREAACHLSDLRAECECRALHRLCGREDAFSLGREQISADGSTEHRWAELRLQCCEAPAHRRVPDAQAPRRDGDASNTRDSEKHTHMVPVYLCIFWQHDVREYT